MNRADILIRHKEVQQAVNETDRLHAVWMKTVVGTPESTDAEITFRAYSKHSMELTKQYQDLCTQFAYQVVGSRQEALSEMNDAVSQNVQMLLLIAEKQRAINLSASNARDQLAALASYFELTSEYTATYNLLLGLRHSLISFNTLGCDDETRYQKTTALAKKHKHLAHIFQCFDAAHSRYIQ